MLEPAEPDASDAGAYVRRFYGLLNGYRYQSAWALTPSSVQTEAGSFEDWRRGYRANLSSHPSIKRVRLLGGGDEAAVALTLAATDVDACTGEHVKQVFAGSWAFTRNGDEWEPESVDLEKIAGPSPTLSFSDCPAPEIPDEPQDVAPAAGAYDAIDTPAPDLDCADVGRTNFYVPPSDPNGFDADGDGIGCES